jgi:hypothetical protein
MKSTILERCTGSYLMFALNQNSKRKIYNNNINKEFQRQKTHAKKKNISEDGET